MNRRQLFKTMAALVGVQLPLPFPEPDVQVTWGGVPCDLKRKFPDTMSEGVVWSNNKLYILDDDGHYVEL